MIDEFLRSFDMIQFKLNGNSIIQVVAYRNRSKIIEVRRTHTKKKNQRKFDTRKNLIIIEVVNQQNRKIDNCDLFAVATRNYNSRK